MTRKTAVLLPALFVSFSCLGAFATPLIVTNASPAWQSVASGAGATYVLPAAIPNCGSENETSCEPTGTFYFNQTWSGNASYISLSDVTGGISDIIMFDSLGPGGVFRILFFSDPTLPDSSLYANYTHFADYAETADGVVTAAIPVCCITQGDGTLSVVLASDGESSFHPFGVDFDISDTIQFQGATPGSSVPEPASSLLIGLGLAGLAGWRKVQRARR